MTKPRSNLFIITLLGALGVISPLSIDMYLPAFPSAAQEFGVQTAEVSATLSTYFIDLAAGQLFYGLLLDRAFASRPMSRYLPIATAMKAWQT